MNMKKRLTALLLIAAMLLSFAGCKGCNTKPNDNQTPVAQITEQPSSNTPTTEPAMTEEPTAEPTPESTPEPTKSPEEIKALQEEAEAAFWALDNELFMDTVTSSITSLDQYCEHPEDFGIDESTVPVTLGEFTAEANDEWVEQCIAYREKLSAIDRNYLSDQLQFAYDTYCRYFDMEIESKDWFYCYEPLDEYVGLQVNMPLFFGLYSIKDQQDIENYLTLMADMPRYYGQVLAFEQERANRGLFMTETMLDEVLSEIEPIMNSADTSYLHETFPELLEDQDYLTDAQRKEYIARNDELVRTAWVEAYKLLYDGLEELRPMCRARMGAKEQGGNAYDYYCWKMKVEASNNRTPEEELKFLESCTRTIYSIYGTAYAKSSEKISAGEKVMTGSLEGDEAYLKTLMPQIVPEMPEVSVVYKEVPEELQDGFSPAAYLTPALDGYQNNIILTNPKDDEHYDMSTLAHEGFPGHMYQFTYQYNLGTIPKFQLMIESNGYAESWSTNAEWNIAQLHVDYDKNLAIATVMWGFFTSNILACVSLKVNAMGADQKEIREYLTNYGLQRYTKLMYDYAIDMPIYYFKYAGGFCELFDLTNRYAGNDKVAFYTEYLHWGPSYFDLLNERMNEWANAK